MADIFISYSKVDRLKAETLAAALEAEGWSVWFDRSLQAGEDFSDEISAQLARARVVIVLWTEASVRSSWVRSEAGRAMADRKLVPVKLAHIAYPDLPQPFDVLHTEDIANTAEIKAANVTQLAKPAVAPGGFWFATSELRYQVLTWVGIVGGALTLFSGFSALLQLASWAQWLVTHWQAVSFGFWRSIGAVISVSVSQAWVPLLSLLMFALTVAIGQRFALAARVKQAGVKVVTPEFRVIPAVIAALLTILVSATWFSMLWAALPPVQLEKLQLLQPTVAMIRTAVAPLGEATISIASSFPSTIGASNPLGVFLAFSLSPFAVVLWSTKARLHAGIVIVLALAALFILVAVPMYRASVDLGTDDRQLELFMPGAIASCLIWLLPLVMLAIAPTRALARRLMFLAIGVALLLGLNELSKLGLDPRAPHG